MCKKISFIFFIFTLKACGPSNDTAESFDANNIQEISQIAGENLVSLDESTGNLNGGFSSKISTSCQAVDFSSCNSDSKVRSFTNCTTASGATVSGSITLNFYGSQASSCRIPSTNDYVIRNPLYSIEGVRGYTLSVSSATSGQIITRTGAATFTFQNTGITRRLTNSNNSLVGETNSSTSGTIVITGLLRSNRSLSGNGSFIIQDTVNNTSCSLTPQNLTWSTGCNCPTGGALEGSCSHTGDYSLEFGTTCGSVTVSTDSISQALTLDRCQ